MPGNIQSYFSAELYVQRVDAFSESKKRKRKQVSVSREDYITRFRSLLDFKKQRDLNGEDKNNRTPKPNAERFVRRTTHSKLSS